MSSTLLASHADVLTGSSRAGTCDEPLRISAWEATTLRDWLKKLAPSFPPIRSRTIANYDSFVHVFPRFASAAYCITSRF